MLSLDVRFGRFAYLRMRLALIDWERKTFRDRRPGRTRHPELLDLVEYHDELDASSATAFEDLSAGRAPVAAWSRAAAIDGLSLAEWVLTVVDREAQRPVTTLVSGPQS